MAAMRTPTNDRPKRRTGPQTFVGSREHEKSLCSEYAHSPSMSLQKRAPVLMLRVELTVGHEDAAAEVHVGQGLEHLQGLDAEAAQLVGRDRKPAQVGHLGERPEEALAR